MKISARNQLPGIVKAVHLGAVNAEIEIVLEGGDLITASITKESVENLGLKADKNVIALIKAPQVIIVADFGGYKLSARNQLPGEIAGLNPGAVNNEVIIKLKSGAKMVATVTNDSMENLSLKKGLPVTAVFKAGAVILAVAG